MRPPLIYVTATPSNQTVIFAAELAAAGADGMRIIAKGRPPEHYRSLIPSLLEVRRQGGERFVAVLDLPGGRPRLGQSFAEVQCAPGDPVSLQAGELAASSTSAPGRVPTENLFRYIDYVRPGGRILIADGAIDLRVREVRRDSVEAVCERADIPLSPGRSINIPDAGVRYEELATADLQVVEAIADLKEPSLSVAVSMVSGSASLETLRARLGPSRRIIAKIETRLGLDAVDEIAEAADAIMVARGDLSVELGVGAVGGAQEEILHACSRHGKPAVAASGLLESVAWTSRVGIADAIDVRLFWNAGVQEYLLSGTVAVIRPLSAARLLRALLSEFALLARPERQPTGHGGIS